MISNAPFKDLLPQYMPVQQLGHYPPRLSFGFAIHNECSAFRQVALEKKLGRRKVIMKMRSFYQLQALVLDHLNKECDLPPEDGIRVNWICSKDACLVLELETNYEEVIPTEKMIKAIKVIKRVFGFPRGARPKWYLEDDIDLRDPDEFLYERKSPVSVLHNSRTKYLTTLMTQRTCSNGAIVRRLRNGRDRTISYPILNAFRFPHHCNSCSCISPVFLYPVPIRPT